MSAPTHSYPRPPRFEIKDNPPGCRLDHRKITLLRALARNRFLTSVQLAETDGGSHQKVLRILRTLYDHELVVRPPAQRFQLAPLENRPLVYSLGHAGARLLAEMDGAPLSEYNWTSKIKRRTAETIIHTIATADVMRAFAKNLAQRGWDLFDQRDLIAKFPETTRAPKKASSPFSLRMVIERKNDSPLPISVVPDRLFSAAHRPGERFNFALELDRGTMPVKRWSNRKKQILSFDGTSIARKLIVYHSAWEHDLHTSRWGFKQFRVLFVTPTRARIDEMLDAVEFITDGKGTRLFVFTDLATLLSNDPFGPIWIDGKRETTALLD